MEILIHKTDIDRVVSGGEAGKAPNSPSKSIPLPLRCKCITIEPSPGFTD